MQRALRANALDRALEAADARADQAAVRLYLGLARSPGADATPQPLQVRPLPR